MMARRLNASRPLRIISVTRCGGDSAMPGAAPIAAAKSLLAAQGIAATQIAVVEVMEAFAAQAIACVEGIGVQESALNRGGGGLARTTDRCIGRDPGRAPMKCNRNHPVRLGWRRSRPRAGSAAPYLRRSEEKDGPR
ncbi:hypothetical protein [Bradyrhizobium sp. ORS 111]|uniref:hypothetical protein n=1 Tax=Bradyrhizobium sp. ORS 111 TaxID=1685958 RepID=UPI003890D7D4